MRKMLTLLVAFLLTGALAAQQYEFTQVVNNPYTELKNQGRTGTCWCFATLSFLESELIRMEKGTFDLSEMFVVRGVYKTRFFDNYLRRGRGNLGPGSLSHTTTRAIAKYGLMPESLYGGINYDSPGHNHTELQGFINAIAEVPIKVRRLSPQTVLLLDALLDIYLGEAPETFTYEGTEHTPLSFVDYLGLDMDNYVEITSYTHHPFYKQVPIEVPDNWEHTLYYNVPLDEFMSIANHALNNGYTIAWDGSLSRNFSQENGVAVEPGRDPSKDEINVDQEIRQEMYQTFQSGDDHLMHVTGIARDQYGVTYYITKNSWGEAGKHKGFVYMSENYFKARCVAYMVHKDAIPKAIRKKLGL
ncbi:MAG: aminopeptidase [Bacteroidales bacterium]|nr:aminopeptidase [Bacteroidales bacterium]